MFIFGVIHSLIYLVNIFTRCLIATGFFVSLLKQCCET